MRAEVRKCGNGEGGSVEKVTTAIGVRVRTRRLPGERGMMRAAGLREWSVSKPCKGGGRKGGKGDDGSWRQGKNQEIAQRKGNDEGRWPQEWSVSKPCKGFLLQRGGRKRGKGDDGRWRQGKNQEISRRKGSDEGSSRQEWSVSKPCKGEGGKVEKVTTAAGVRAGQGKNQEQGDDDMMMTAVGVRSGATQWSSAV